VFPAPTDLAPHLLFPSPDVAPAVLGQPRLSSLLPRFRIHGSRGPPWVANAQRPPEAASVFDMESPQQLGTHGAGSPLFLIFVPAMGPAPKGQWADGYLSP